MQPRLSKHVIFLLSCLFAGTAIFAQIFGDVGISGTLHMFGGNNGQVNPPFRINNGPNDDGGRFRVGSSGTVTINVPSTNALSFENYKLAVLGNTFTQGIVNINGNLDFRDVAGNSSKGSKIFLWRDPNYPEAAYRFGVNTFNGIDELTYTVPAYFTDHVFRAGAQPGGSELMRITGDNYLQLNGELQLRQGFGPKITLSGYSSTPNSFGFGLSTNQLAYRVGGSEDNHIFYAGGSNADGVELMRIQGNGNVGIGTATPGNYKLAVLGNTFTQGIVNINGNLDFRDVAGNSSKGSKIFLWRDPNYPEAAYRFGVNTFNGIDELTYTVPAYFTDHVFRAGAQPGGSELMRITGDNYLQLNGELQLRQGFGPKITLSGYSSTPNSFGFGLSTHQLAYRVGGSEDNHIFYAGGSNANGVELMRIQGNGNVGIGTATPGNYKLAVNGTVNINQNLSFSSAMGDKITLWGSGGPNSIGFGINPGKLDYHVSGSTDAHVFNAGGWELMRIQGNGNVGIGTATPGNYKLAVEGTLGARAIQVKTTAWADFVFDSRYQLRPLNEVESFIAAHKHLPDVPSEEKVKKDGINVANMDAVLLQKIEELTLYVIDQNKRIETLEKENILLKKK